jgi:hypothetical protein
VMPGVAAGIVRWCGQKAIGFSGSPVGLPLKIRTVARRALGLVDLGPCRNDTGVIRAQPIGIFFCLRQSEHDHHRSRGSNGCRQCQSNRSNFHLMSASIQIMRAVIGLAHEHTADMLAEVCEDRVGHQIYCSCKLMKLDFTRFSRQIFKFRFVWP